MCIPEVIQLPVGCAEDSKFGRAESELQIGKCLGQGKFWIFLCIFTSDLFHANWALYLLKFWYFMLCMSYLGWKVTFNKINHTTFFLILEPSKYWRLGISAPFHTSIYWRFVITLYNYSGFKTNILFVLWSPYIFTNFSV